MQCQLSFLAHPLSWSTALIASSEQWAKIVSELSAQVHRADFWQGGDPEKLLSMVEVRTLRQFAELSPVGKGKIACLLGADQYRPEVANALLKLLEESPEYLLIVLLSETDHFLSTIRSRVDSIVVTGNSATIDTSGWSTLLGSYNLKSYEGRAKARQTLYLQSLVHSGIKAERIIESFTYSPTSL